MSGLKITDRRASASVFDQWGSPAVHRRQSRSTALAGGGFGPPYDAADAYSRHMATWQPYLGSPDNELNPYRDRMVARARDLERNDGWARGVTTRATDNAIGATYRPVSKPDYRALAAPDSERGYAGNKGFDPDWADEYGRAVDAAWRSWADDPGRYCDAGRRMNFRQMARVALRHELIDGDSLALVLWLPGRVGDGCARFATSIQLLDPDRLSNPNNTFDNATIRGGVEIDENDAPIAYHIRKAHPAAGYYDSSKAYTWERVLREDQFGRPRVVHNFTADRAQQHRGGAGIFTPIIQRLKMLIKYDGTELDAAILNAIFGAYIESPNDPQLVAEAMGGDDTDLSGLAADQAWQNYQAFRQQFHQGRAFSANGVRFPILGPGEKIQTVTAQRPNSNFAEFEGAVLRNVAAGCGLSAQQVSNNWRDVNYSSARGALLEAWKTMDRRSADFGDGFAQPIRVAWLEELHERQKLPMPSGEVPSFIQMRGAYARCRWMQPGRGWMDPVKEKQGAILGLQAGLSTLEDEAANQGLDWEDIVDQRAIEVARFRAAGLPLPAPMAAPPEQNNDQGGGGDKE